MKTSEKVVHGAESQALLRRGLLVEYVSLAWMTVEALVAITAGVFSGSLALLAFGGDSVIELVSSIAVLGHLRTEDKGEGNDDKTGRTERVTLLLLFLLIPVIALGTTYAYFSGVQPQPSALGILIALCSLVIMPVLWFEKHRIGKEANCFPIEVDATESATCFLMSAALLVGLVANFYWRLWGVDYLATVIITLFLAKEAVGALRNLRAKDEKGIL